MRRLLLILLVCGAPSAHAVTPRVLGGTTAAKSDVPAAVAFVVLDLPHRSATCGGTLISPQIVLAAAHCVDSVAGGRNPETVFRKRIGVVVGSTDLAKGRMARIDRLIVHPDYDPSLMSNDIALVTLTEPQSTPTMPIASRPWRVGARAVVAGWGDADRRDPPARKRVAKVTRVAASTCARYNGENAGALFVADTQLCTRGVRATACHRDSGGPLVSRGQVIGVVSYGSVRCRKGGVGVFTDVLAFRGWIAGAL